MENCYLGGTRRKLYSAFGYFRIFTSCTASIKLKAKRIVILNQNYQDLIT